MQYSVEVKNVTKRIGNNLIIDDVSFNLEKGKIYGLIGANGSGKSTLLKIILGLYKSQGEVFINGYNIRLKYREAMSDIAGIVDFVSFYDYLTAYENLRYFAMLYEVPFERIMEVMKIVNLEKDNKQVKKYSLGMKQRLGLAISLLKDPSVLILDEPTNGLDPKGVVELRNLLKSFKDKTIIISSHIIAEIEKVVDEVLFINNKKIIKRSVKRNDIEKAIKFKVDNYEKASKVLNQELHEDKAIYMNDTEVSNSIKKLSLENVSIYRVEEDSLEELLLSMMEAKND